MPEQDSPQPTNGQPMSTSAPVQVAPVAPQGIVRQYEAAPAIKGQDSLVDLVNVIADRMDPLLKLATTIGDRTLNVRESEARFHIRMTWIAVVVVSLIVGAAGVLTFVNRIDGATFTFLLGLIVGYMLTFLKESITPKES